ncbi:MAG: hypothetical protein CMJ64_19705 [Planctomycetaceae bacterium]|nr:hypothetical protein [Planctomycetaceae bacterium]
MIPVSEVGADLHQADEGTPPMSAIPIRCGSPFADRGSAETALLADASAVASSPATVDRSKRSYDGSTTAAALTFPIGGIALILAFSFPTGGIVVAAFGIAIGTWGLSSRRCGVALAGLMLCCLCLAIAGFNTAVEVYVHFYGVAPWETNDPAFP